MSSAYSPFRTGDPKVDRNLDALAAAQAGNVSDLSKALKVGSTLRVFNPYTATSPLVMPTDFAAATFSGAWTNFGSGYQSVGYMKDALGFVHLRGLATNPNTLAAGSVIFVLPVGYRPANLILAANNATGTASSGRIDIDNAGNVKCVAAFTASDFRSLECITFRTADGAPGVPSCFPFTVSWPNTAAPTFVMAQAQDVSNAASPSNLALSVPDWTYASGALTIRNIPGLLPSKSYAVQIIAF